jgi:predicted RNase H-like nuclease (RuvC/YqgF family)
VAPIAKAAPKQEAPAAIQASAASNPVSNDSKSLDLSNDELLSKKLDELRQAREANKMKESEIAILKREVEWMKRELRERTAEVKAIKAGKASARPAPKKKAAEAFSTR